MTWIIPGESYLRRYDNTYDGMNRLTEGAYSHLVAQTLGILQGIGSEPLVMGGTESEALPLGLIPVINDPGNLLLPDDNGPDRYTDRISFDKNSNITSLERYGMNNQRHYGLIDSLVITRNGNQLKTIEDYAEKDLTYTGASDFYDGLTNSTEYTYNANGALSKDMNRGIGHIGYDDLGNLRRILYHNGIAYSIEYIYAADGTKLRTIHRGSGGLNAYVDSIDYVGNLILKNGQPEMYLFDGGYASFNNDTVNGWHYYISDYMGNNRMVVNSNGTVEQITHYYPYGGVIGDISTNENVQKYKFEGKELDRTFGLDNYDIHARQYFAMAPMWDRVDPLAEDNPQFSPYSYCMGNPVNLGDYNGMDEWSFDQNGNVVSRIRKEDYDLVRIVNESGKNIASKQWGYGTIMNEENQTFDVPLEINGSQAGSEIFEFLSDNTSVEWTEIKTNDSFELGCYDFISTSHEKSSESTGMPLALDLLKAGYLIMEMNHNHPSGSLNPSGLVSRYNKKKMKIDEAFQYGDVMFAQALHSYSSDIKFNIYTKGKYRSFDETGAISFPFIKNELFGNMIIFK